MYGPNGDSSIPGIQASRVWHIYCNMHFQLHAIALEYRYRYNSNAIGTGMESMEYYSPSSVELYTNNDALVY